MCKGETVILGNILYDRSTTLPDTRNHFRRPRVDKLLATTLEHHLVVVTAGAGWGKTQAVSYFMRFSDTNFIWLQLSKLENYAVRFWESFTYAVGLRNTVLASRLSAFGFPDSAALFHNFLHVFAELTADIDKLVFIFDDVHLINAPSIVSFIENLVYARLKNLTIILIGRNMPDFNLQALYIDSEVCHITEEDLSFTKNEAADYFAEQEIILPKDSFEEIYSGTAGWISAIYLTSLSLKKRGISSINAFTIAKLQIFELIEQEIFSKYSSEIQHILVKWSVFERIPDDFIKKYLERGSNLMNEIEKTNLFIRFNPITKTYDIHHLFLEFLLTKQPEYLTDDELNQVHFQIADWHHKHGNEIGAITHYCQCDHNDEIWEIIKRYDMQTPITVSNLFLGLIENFPECLWERHPLIAVVHARLLLMTGKLVESFQKFLGIINKYESLPSTVENKAVLGETFIYLGMISLLSFDYKFLELFKKAAEYLPGGSSIVDNRFGYSDGNFMVTIKESTPGEIDKFINAIMEAMPYCAEAMNGGGYGVEYVTKSEADYYTNKMKEAEMAAYTAIYKAEQQQQYDTICAAYFVLVRVYINAGDYDKAASCVKELENKMNALQEKPEKAPYIKRSIYTYTVLRAWYYSRLGDYEQIPDWILRKEERYKVPSAGYYLRDEFIHAYCLLENQNYQELSGLLAVLESYYNRSGLLIARIKIYIFKAIMYHKTDNISNSMEAFVAAYDLAHANSIIMPFVEFGKYMRTLIYAAKRSELITISEAWLDETYAKAATYEKHLNNIKSQHQQTLGLALNTSIKLTKREKELLSYLCQGLTNAEIASKCFITTSAVKKSLNNIYVKLDATNRADAVRIAIQMGLHK